MSEAKMTRAVDRADTIPAMTITFERFERDCEYNRRRRRDEDDLKSLIYDYRVVIDGEFRAILHRAIGVGYLLYDAGLRPIPSHYSYYNHIGLHVKKKDDFDAAVRENIARIPSADGLREIAVAEEMLAIEVDHEARRRVRVRLAQARGHDLLQALILLKSAVRAGAKVNSSLHLAECAIREATTHDGFATMVENEIRDIRRNLPSAVS